MYTGRPTVGRLPPGFLSIAVHQVDHIVYVVAVSVIVRVILVLRVTLKTLVWLLPRQRTQVEMDIAEMYFNFFQVCRCQWYFESYKTLGWQCKILKMTPMSKLNSHITDDCADVFKITDKKDWVLEKAEDGKSGEKWRKIAKLQEKSILRTWGKPKVHTCMCM